MHENQIGVKIIQAQNRSMAEKSVKSHVEVSDVDEQSGIVTHERNLPRYLSDYTEVPGKN